MTQTILKMIVDDLSIYHIERMLNAQRMRDLIDLEDYRTLVIDACISAFRDSRKPIYWFDAVHRVVELIENIMDGTKCIESTDMTAQAWKDWLVGVFYHIENKFRALLNYEYFDHYAKVVIAHYSLLSVFKHGELTFEYVGNVD